MRPKSTSYSTATRGTWLHRSPETRATLSWLMFVFAMCMPTVTTHAQSLATLAAAQEQKIDAALSRLKQQRQNIQNNQLPLVQELHEWEGKAKTLRNEVAKKRAVRDSKSVSLETLKSNLAAQTKEYDYIRLTLFGEYIADYQAALSAGEQTVYQDPIQSLNLLLEQPDTTETEKLRQSLTVIEQSLERIRSLIGGKRYPGEAIHPGGQLVAGQFVQTGPLLYFSGKTLEDTGIVEEGTSLQARIRTIEQDLAAAVQTVATQGSGRLPIDPSLGDALALEQTRDSLGEHLRKGGVWVYPIILFAVLSTVVAVAKFVQIFMLRQPGPLVVHDIVKFIREGEIDKARTLAAQQPQPAADMLRNAVDHANESVELVEEVMYESMLSTQPKLERFLNIIAVTAAIAPLLGLLGTVTGIIKTFELMQVFGAGDPKPLISGISEALITTELGLVLAIPALIIHALLARKVAGAMAHLENLAVAFVNGLSRKTVNP